MTLCWHCLHHCFFLGGHINDGYKHKLQSPTKLGSNHSLLHPHCLMPGNLPDPQAPNLQGIISVHMAQVVVRIKQDHLCKAHYVVYSRCSINISNTQRNAEGVPISAAWHRLFGESKCPFPTQDFYLPSVPKSEHNEQTAIDLTNSKPNPCKFILCITFIN